MQNSSTSEISPQFPKISTLLLKIHLNFINKQFNIPKS